MTCHNKNLIIIVLNFFCFHQIFLCLLLSICLYSNLVLYGVQYNSIVHVQYIVRSRQMFSLTSSLLLWNCCHSTQNVRFYRLDSDDFQASIQRSVKDTSVAFHLTLPACQLRSSVSAKDLNMRSTSFDIANVCYSTVKCIAILGYAIFGLLQ
jgi:hypothetical protein